MLLYIVGGIIAFIAVLSLIVCVYAFFKGTDDSVVLLEKRTLLKLESLSETEAVFSTEFPLVNRGNEDAAILDIFPRPYLPQEQFDSAIVYGHIESIDRRRKDNYFEAVMLKSRQEIMLIMTLRFVANKGLTIREAMEGMVDMDVAVYLNGSARKDVYVRKEFATFRAEEFRILTGGGADDGKI